LGVRFGLVDAAVRSTVFFLGAMMMETISGWGSCQYTGLDRSRKNKVGADQLQSGHPLVYSCCANTVLEGCKGMSVGVFDVALRITDVLRSRGQIMNTYERDSQ